MHDQRVKETNQRKASISGPGESLQGTTPQLGLPGGCGWIPTDIHLLLFSSLDSPAKTEPRAPGLSQANEELGLLSAFSICPLSRT